MLFSAQESEWSISNAFILSTTFKSYAHSVKIFPPGFLRHLPCFLCCPSSLQSVGDMGSSLGSVLWEQLLQSDSWHHHSWASDVSAAAGKDRFFLFLRCVFRLGSRHGEILDSKLRTHDESSVRSEPRDCWLIFLLRVAIPRFTTMTVGALLTSPVFAGKKQNRSLEAHFVSCNTVANQRLCLHWRCSEWLWWYLTLSALWLFPFPQLPVLCLLAPCLSLFISYRDICSSRFSAVLLVRVRK